MNLMTFLAHGKTERDAGEDHVFIERWGPVQVEQRHHILPMGG
jgi:hypothetical protein